MRRLDQAAFAASAVLFAVFFGSVAVGAAARSPVVGDVTEMLTLLAACAAFVVGVLAREHRERGGRS